MYPEYDYMRVEDLYGQESVDVCPAAYMLPYMPPFDEFDEEDETAMTRQPPYTISSLLKSFEAQAPATFAQLEAYRIPRFFIRRIFRSVIGYVLRNVIVTEPLPMPVDSYAVLLYNDLVAKQPMFASVFNYFGVPFRVIKETMISLITFVLKSLPFPGSAEAVTP